MGKGDKKTARGKRFLGSYGISRSHKVAKLVERKKKRLEAKASMSS